MRRYILIYTIISYLIVGWTFLFAGTILVNYISENLKSNLKSNNTFKDISYSDLNKYDLQSTLMIRSDYFNQGLDPSNYAFSFGIKIPTLDNVSVLPSDSNYWFDRFIGQWLDLGNEWNFSLHSIHSDGKGGQDDYSSFFINPTMSHDFKPISLYVKINDISYMINFREPVIFKYMFMPYFANQSYRSFKLDYLVFNFNYKKIFNESLIKNWNIDFYIDGKKQSKLDINTLYDVFFTFYNSVLRSLFSFDYNNYVNISSNKYFGFILFVKNGFLLYPRSFIFDINTFSGSVASFVAEFQNAYKISYNSDYYSTYYDWSYDTDILPFSTNNNFAKFLDMTDTSKYRGFNVFNLFTNEFDDKFSADIHSLNFSIYNSADWSGEINGGDIWKIPYKSCGITHILGCIENAFIWAFNNVPGIDYVGKFIGALVHIFSNVNALFDNISNLFAFDITFKIMLGSLITLAMVNGLIRLIG